MSALRSKSFASYTFGALSFGAAPTTDSGPTGGGLHGQDEESRDRRRSRSRAIALALLAAEYDRYP